MWIALIFMFSLFIIFIVALMYHVSYLKKTEQPIDKSIFIVSMIIIYILGSWFGIMVNMITTPTIEDYIRGNVEVTIEQTIKNGEIIKQDTVYRKL